MVTQKRIPRPHKLLLSLLAIAPVLSTYSCILFFFNETFICEKNSIKIKRHRRKLRLASSNMPEVLAIQKCIFFASPEGNILDLIVFTVKNSRHVFTTLTPNWTDLLYLRMGTLLFLTFSSLRLVLIIIFHKERVYYSCISFYTRWLLLTQYSR